MIPLPEPLCVVLRENARGAHKPGHDPVPVVKFFIPWAWRIAVDFLAQNDYNDHINLEYWS